MFPFRLASATVAGLLFTLLLGRAAGADSALVVKVEALLKQLTADPAAAARTEEARHAANEALSQAARERAQGNAQKTAEVLEATALEWAELGQDITVTGAREQSAREVERALIEASQQVRRAEAFLEETEARRGRALSQLESAQNKPSTVTPARAITPIPPSAEPRPEPAPSPKPTAPRD